MNEIRVSSADKKSPVKSRVVREGSMEEVDLLELA